MIACGSEACAAKYVDPMFVLEILGSSVCMCDPRIIAQSSDPRFVQQNPRMVRIRTLHLTYMHLTYIQQHICLSWLPAVGDSSIGLALSIVTAAFGSTLDHLLHSFICYTSGIFTYAGFSGSW